MANIRGYVSVARLAGPIEDARVVLRSPLQTIETRTDRWGFFSMLGVIPVPHASIVVSRDGYLSKWSDIPICTGATLRLAVALPSFCTMCLPYILVNREDYAVSGSTYVVNPEPFESTTWQGQC